MEYDDWVMGALAAQDNYQPTPVDPWKAMDAAQVSRDIVPERNMPFGVTTPQEEAVAAPQRAAPIMAAIKGAATIPKDMIEGSQRATRNGLDNSEYNPAPAVELMQLMYGVNSPFTKVGAAGAFGGRLGRTADLDAYNETRDLLKKGYQSDDILPQTGWRKDIDNRLKYEFTDHDSGFIPSGLANAYDKPVKLGEAFHWPEAYKAYPELAETKFQVTGDPKAGGSGFVSKGSYTGPDYGYPASIVVSHAPKLQMHETVLHEGGHGIQDIENFATGGNTAMQQLVPGNPAWRIYSEEILPHFIGGTKPTGIPHLEKNWDAILSHTDDPTKQIGYLKDFAKFEAYRRMAGEAEARNIPNRMWLTPEQRIIKPPKETLDVPYHSQSVLFPRKPTGPTGHVFSEEAPAVRPVMGSVAAMPDKVESPAILTRREPTADDIATIKASAAKLGKGGWPDAQREIFPTRPEDYAETTKLVPQVSVKGQLPGPLPGEKLPNNERAASIVANRNAIATEIATRLDPLVRADSPLLKFYHTAPAIRGIERYGEMPAGDAAQFMREWSGQGAATSPRTQTPPNLRNSSFLLHERASGNPMTPERYAREGNQPGFGMMGMHVDLADKFNRGMINPWTNPKPFTFRENWSGNLRDVTGDTHNIRGTLYEADKLHPGSLPREFFTSDEAFAKYRREGFLSLDPGAINDSLGSKIVKGVKRQSEYLPMTEPWYLASDMLKIDPAAAQSGGWFSYGGITGLQSPPKTITNLLNDQIHATAKELGVPEETIVNWWSRGKIPLTAIGGAALLAPEVMRDRSNHQ